MPISFFFFGHGFFTILPLLLHAHLHEKMQSIWKHRLLAHIVQLLYTVIISSNLFSPTPSPFIYHSQKKPLANSINDMWHVECFSNYQNIISRKFIIYSYITSFGYMSNAVIKLQGIVCFALAHCRIISGHHPHSGCMYLCRTVVDIDIVH